MEKRSRKIVQTRLLLLSMVACLFFGIITIVSVINRLMNLGTYSMFDNILYFVFAPLLVVFFVYFTIAVSKDGLTGIPNPDAIMLKMIMLMVRHRMPEYASVFINIKNMKFINRILGSAPGGDLVIRKYAQMLNEYVKGDKIAGRLGGDNFIVVIQKHRLDDFLKFLDNINISVVINGEKQVVRVESRCGIYPLKDGDNPSQAIGKASSALNFAKAKRSNDQVWYDEVIEDAMLKEKEISYNFTEAIKRKEFKVYYQPKVDMTTKRICGAEALVRWEKDDGIIVPYNFVPALERSGLITELDFYVFNNVCSDIKEWINEGIDIVPVSVNFSKMHLRDDKFSNKIINEISTQAIDKTYIQIELTESTDHDDYDSLNAFLERMYNENIDIAIDDFGIGYSSLELLKSPYVSTVKIDESFITGIDKNNGENNDAYLVRNMLHTCQDLKKEVVCEGVESLKQMELLREMRCSVVQGFLFDRPLPKKEFVDKLATPVYD